MAALLSVGTIKRRAYSKHFPSMSRQLSAFISVVESLPVERSWSLDVKSHYRTVLRNLIRKARHIERLDARRCARVSYLDWQLANGKRLASTAECDAQLAWLLNRGKTRNVHAQAMGKRVSLKYGREHYSRIGKLGAQRRWHPEQK